MHSPSPAHSTSATPALMASATFSNAAMIDVASFAFTSIDVLPASVPAVQNQNVWDTGRIRDPMGGLDWFTSRLATPDVLVESIAQILYPQMNIRSVAMGNAWFQNVYTQAACVPPGGTPTAAGLAAQCTDPNTPFLPDRGFTCPPPPPPPVHTCTAPYPCVNT